MPSRVWPRPAVRQGLLLRSLNGEAALGDGERPMTTVPARNLVDGDRIRVKDHQAALIDVVTEGDTVRALGSGGEVFRWLVDDLVELDGG